MRKQNWIPISLVAIVAVLVVVVLRHTPQTQETAMPKETLAISASFYPIAEFTRAVGGELVAVNTITPSGTEPHDYEPTPSQMKQIYASAALIYNGQGLDAWAERIAPDLREAGVEVWGMDDGIQLVNVENPLEHTEHEADHFADPHFWLNPKNAMKEVDMIQALLARLDPGNADIYKTNADTYKKQLVELDEQYKTGLENCEKRFIISSHATLAYLGNEYQFTATPIAGISPEEEPSAGRLAELTKLAKREGVTSVFFETLVSPKLAQTLAQDLGLKSLVFNPLEGLTEEEVANGETYLSVMKSNLTQLKEGMMCQ